MFFFSFEEEYRVGVVVLWFFLYKAVAVINVIFFCMYEKWYLGIFVGIYYSVFLGIFYFF